MSFNLISTLVGESPAIKQIYQQLPAIAASSQPVLLLGELATGKDSIAQEIHQSSSRQQQQLVVLKARNDSMEVLESVLFGHLKDAFAGALNEQPGLVMQANQGTLFIDGIENLSLDLQAKLLSALKTKQYFQVGGNQLIGADFRLIAGATEQLFQRLAANQFLPELYNLFADCSLEVPALCERSEDLASLLQVYFLKIQSELPQYEFNKIPALSAEVLQALENYDWPGNLRELECLAESLLALNLDQVNFADLPELYQQEFSKDQLPLGLIQDDIGFLLNRDSDDFGCEFGFNSAANNDLVEISDYDFAAQMPLKDFIEQIEIKIIEQALCKTANNVMQASKLLAINRTTLIEKMRKYQLNN